MADHLRELENQSVYILREAYKHFKSLCMLWSIGKDSTVMLWLARKAFFGHVPLPLVHIDTSYKIPEMIAYRDKLAREWNLRMVVGQNTVALADGMSHHRTRMVCCGALKTHALKQTLDGTAPRWILDPRAEPGRGAGGSAEGAGGLIDPNAQTGDPIDASGKQIAYDQGGASLRGYVLDPKPEPYTGVIVGARADEEGSRAKERYFSPRDKNSDWNVGDQPPEFWSQFKTDFAPGTHVRIHPLLDWTEVNIWEYIERENIPIIDLYFDRGDGIRFRSLGCAPCTGSIKSTAKNPREIIEELKTTKVAERAGRAQDQEDPHAMEKLRREGYM